MAVTLPPGDDETEEAVTPFRRLVGTRLRLARLRAKLTQVDVAQRTGIQQAYVSKIERGTVNIKLGTLESLCRAIGTEPIAVIAGDGLTSRDAVRLLNAAHDAALQVLSDRDPGAILSIETVTEITAAVHSSVKAVLDLESGSAPE